MHKHVISLSIALMGLCAPLFAYPAPTFFQVARRGSSVPTLPPTADVRSGDWKVRRVAFGKLIGEEGYSRNGLAYIAPVLKGTIEKDPSTAEARKTYLIELLEIENAFVENEKRLSEEYVNYYGDVIAAVSNLKDPRSLRALIGAITTGGMATGTLISFGTLAIEPVAKELESSRTLVRLSAAWTLSEMLERSKEISKDPGSKLLIKKALLQAASDNDPNVRRNAVDGLARVGDPESIAVVERIARDDPYQADYPGKEGRYIVREAAVEALKTHGGK